MNWITRCPACRTNYVVSSEQRHLAQGWLRCGHCQQAFDSTGLVLAWPEKPPMGSGEGPAQMAADRLILDDLLKQEDRSMAQPKVSALEALEAALATFKPVLPDSRTARPKGWTLASDHRRATGVALPSRRRTWIEQSIVFALSILLLLQCLWVQRIPLAAALPDVVAKWNAACRTLGCEIAPLQMRSGIVIDSSSLSPQETGLVLSFVWRNTTEQALQTPALELTLLGAQGQTLVRRVFLAPELDAPSDLAAGQSWHGQLALFLEEGAVPAGFKLLSFFP